MIPVHNKAAGQKRTKTAKNSLILLKTIDFELMKTIRYELKTSKRFIISDADIVGHKDLSFFNFLCG